MICRTPLFMLSVLYVVSPLAAQSSSARSAASPITLKPMRVLNMDVEQIAFAPDGETFAFGRSFGRIYICPILDKTERPGAAPDAVKRIKALISELDSDSFEQRERAHAKLGEYKELAEPMLKEALANSQSPEVQSRVQALLREVAKSRKDTLGGLALAKLQTPHRTLRALEYSPDGTLLLTAGSYDGTFIIWEVASKKQLRQVHAADGSLHHAVFSPDGRHVATCDDTRITLWETTTGRRIKSFAAHDGEIWCLAFSPDGRYIACSGEPRSAVIVEVDTAKRVARIDGFGDSVGHVDFSPDSKTLAMASEDGTVRLWNLESKRSRTFKGHEKEVWWVTYSPDGRWVASGGDHGDLVLWQIESGRAVVKRQLAKKGYGSSIAFAPKGSILGATTDGALNVAGAILRAADDIDPEADAADRGDDGGQLQILKMQPGEPSAGSRRAPGSMND